MDFKTKLLIALMKVTGGTFIFGVVAMAGFAAIDLVSLLFGFEMAHPLSDKGRYFIYPLIPLVVVIYMYLRLWKKDYGVNENDH